MNEHERQGLLDRIERDGATVGATIPDRLTVGDEPVDLRDEVLALRGTDAPTPAERERTAELVRGLRRERRALVTRLESDALDRETAEELADRAIGIDRALELLGTVGETVDIEDEIQRQKVADSERWRKFIERARGTDVDRSLDR